MTFCVVLVSEALSAQEDVEMLEKEIDCKRTFWRVRMLIEFHIPTQWAFCCDQHRVNLMQFLVHFVFLTEILLHCDGFAQTQKAVVCQTSCRPSNSQVTFLWCNAVFVKCFEASSRSRHWPSSTGYHHREPQIKLKRNSLWRRLEEEGSSRMPLLLLLDWKNTEVFGVCLRGACQRYYT